MLNPIRAPIRAQEAPAMPSKTSKAGKPYKVTGKKFIWSPLDDDDERGNLPDVEIPLRIKMGVIYEMRGRDLDVGAMADILDALIPGQSKHVREMELSDFEAMFTAWQEEYQLLHGATPGE